MKSRHISIVHVLGEFVSCPFLLTIQCREVKCVDRMAIEGSLIAFDHGVVSVDSDRPMIMRNRKGEDLPIQLFLALHRPKKFDKSSYGDGHTVRILAIGNVESGSAAFHLAGEKGEVHSCCSHEICNDLGARLTDKRFQLVQLFLGECGSPESHGKVGLWTSFM